MSDKRLVVLLRGIVLATLFMALWIWLAALVQTLRSRYRGSSA